MPQRLKCAEDCGFINADERAGGFKIIDAGKLLVHREAAIPSPVFEIVEKTIYLINKLFDRFPAQP